MKKFNFVVIFLFLFLTFGCSLLERFKTGTNTNNSTPPPEPTAAQTPSPSPSESPASAEDRSFLGKNLLAAVNGVTVASVSSESQTSDDSGRHLIDEAQFNGWRTADGAVENQSIILELPARTTLKTLVFDTGNLAFAPVAPKDIKVEVSDNSATDGFQTILETTLAADKDGGGIDNQTFQIAQPVPGRFVRYTIKNNYGSPKAIFTKELRGYGEQESITTLQNLTGKYHFESGGFFGGTDIYLKQEGTNVIGCQGSREYLIVFNGGVEGRIVTLKYNYANRDQAEKDSGAMIFSPDAQKINFIYWSGTKKGYDSLAVGSKTSDQITNACPELPDFAGGQDAVKNQLEKSLSEQGRAILYGINFDFNSDQIKQESKPTLDKVVAILKDKFDWKMQIEGHTDNVGGESFNQTLSEKRAASVVKYLTDAGIETARLSSSGAGMSKPVEPNDTEAGRAQNRRVELIKQ